MGITTIDSVRALRDKHVLDDALSFDQHSLLVISIKPPSTHYSCGDAVNYDGDNCFAVCTSDEDGNCLYHAANHIAKLNSIRLEKNEVGYVHTIAGAELGEHVQETVKNMLLELEAVWNKLRDDEEQQLVVLKNKHEVERQTTEARRELAKIDRSLYSDKGWELMIKRFKETYPKAEGLA